MKRVFLMVLVLMTSSVFAAPSPIRNDVAIINSEFSGMIYQALAKKIKPVRIQYSRLFLDRITVPYVMVCDQNTDTLETACTLLQGAWKELGNSVYSVINDTDVKVLHDSLGVKATREPEENIYMTIKSIKLDVPDQDGGTERNMLACTKLGKREIQMGLRNTCQLINAL